ncbi:MAG TPA: glycosyltransferase family 4 protein [Candidatus Paceibacterota bacterium]|nr:glycosyltransferase family 4 protein [Candidatus Paceibacterota bacterium]
MKLLIASPIGLQDIGGPATVARELSRVYEEHGDDVRVITPSWFEKRLPIGVRQLVLFIRAIPTVRWADAVLLLDPVSTGLAVAPLARLLKKRSVLRVGGDFLWEMHANRVREPIRLSEFYAMPRVLTLREHLIHEATRFTLAFVDHIAFTTAWQERIWMEPYNLSGRSTSVVESGVPEPMEAATTDTSSKVFLAASRGPYLKNGDLLAELWPNIQMRHPEAELDTTPRPPEAYRQALAASYALILPSISDVCPNAVLEAIAYGKPFITTKDTGLYELYPESGMFVDTRDPNEIVAAIEKLLDPAGYRDAVARMRSSRRRRTWEDAAAEFRTLLAVP